MTKPLAIVPTYVRQIPDVQVFETAVRTLRETVGDRVDVLVVDDGSPGRDLVTAIGNICETYNCELIDKQRNEGFSKTVNIGMRRCLIEERDAILVNADIEFGLTTDWLTLMENQTDESGEKLASIVGALLLYPNGLIQHGGIYFSMLTRDFGHRFNYGPGNLPEAQQAAICPVTGALQFVRHECMKAIGLYDESFKLGWEDCDYCIRAWLSGRSVVYQPGIRAVHHESFFRGVGRADAKIAQWTEESWLRFVAKYANQSFAEFVPDMMTR